MLFTKQNHKTAELIKNWDPLRGVSQLRRGNSAQIRSGHHPSLSPARSGSIYTPFWEVILSSLSTVKNRLSFSISPTINLPLAGGSLSKTGSFGIEGGNISISLSNSEWHPAYVSLGTVWNVASRWQGVCVCVEEVEEWEVNKQKKSSYTNHKVKKKKEKDVKDQINDNEICYILPVLSLFGSTKKLLPAFWIFFVRYCRHYSGLCN